ncbi:YncE family protein [Herbiconiux sp. P18]|uniref:YncE family protein n=1 Tax=Herbiconiux liangxiaofengii TaxID=3342795 RepID=UPI0035B9F98B
MSQLRCTAATHSSATSRRRGRNAAAVVAAVVAVLAASGVPAAAAAPLRISAELTGLPGSSTMAAVDTRTGILYVLDRSTGDITVMDAGGTRPVSTVASRGGPAVDVAIDPFRRELYVLHDGAPSVQVYDLATHPDGTDATVPVADIALPASCAPADVTIDSVGDHLFVIGPGCGAMTVVDTPSRTVSSMVPGSSSGAIGLDGPRRTVWLAGAKTAEISTFDADSFALVASRSAAAGISEIVPDLDHDRLFVLTDELIELDLHDLSATWMTNTQGLVIDIDLDPSAQVVYALTRSGTLITADKSRLWPPLVRVPGLGFPTSMVRDPVRGLVAVLSPREGLVRLVQ